MLFKTCKNLLGPVERNVGIIMNTGNKVIIVPLTFKSCFQMNYLAKNQVAIIYSFTSFINVFWAFRGLFLDRSKLKLHWEHGELARTGLIAALILAGTKSKYLLVFWKKKILKCVIWIYINIFFIMETFLNTLKNHARITNSGLRNTFICRQY